MATAREHLRESHAKAAEGHTAMSRSHRKLSEHYTKLAGLAKSVKSSMGGDEDPAECMQDIAAEHMNLHSAHAAQAEYHASAAEKCEKAEADAMAKANRIEPSQVMAINPAPHQRVTAVPRAGSPSLQSKIDPFISKIAGLSPSDQNWDEESLSQ